MATKKVSSGRTVSVSHPGAADAKAMELIRSSGVLNPNATLEVIMEVTKRLAAIEPKKKYRHVDTLIHSHFIYQHEE